MAGSKQVRKTRAWTWVPSLYFAQGLPYAIVMSVAPILYKRLGLDNTHITLYTGWLYLPWAIKPFWSPVVELLKTKRWWIVVMQFTIGGGLAGVGLSIPLQGFLPYTLVCFWLLAFSSATHDIAVDGLYMLGLSQRDQAFFVGIRSTCYRLAMLSGQGGLVIVAGAFEKTLGRVGLAWVLTFLGAAALVGILFIYHMWALPRPEGYRSSTGLKARSVFKEFCHTFVTFFTKKKIGWILAFILLYRLGESQLLNIARLFLLDQTTRGGLGLQTDEYGLIYGTVGSLALLVGGVLGGVLTSRHGLFRLLWWLLLAMNLPNAVYIYLAGMQPESRWIITSCVALEQLGYGFGFTGLMLYVIYISKGAYQTAHYAIGTGLWALGMVLPGVVSGWLQEQMGYPVFFVWVMASSLPIFLIAKFISIDPDFGRKNNQARTGS